MSAVTKKFLTNSRDFKILTEIQDQLEVCDEFIISVAFITFSGVICILESLRQLQNKGVQGKILTGCYLNFTEPKALEKILEFKNIELKILDNENFHAKGFFFRQQDTWHIMLGSSNLTQSALTVNNEWNLLFKTSLDDYTAKQILAEFDSLFKQAKNAQDILDQYTQLYQSINSFPQLKKLVIDSSNIVPNKVQSDALENLKNNRVQGLDKALIVSATGTGKTFLSAFDVLKVNPKRCLFIVHRINIAAKAKETFSKIIKHKSLGLYTGIDKSDAEYLFATIQTFKNPRVLTKFKPNEFDYIIIDEVHHAEAKSYKKVLEYFKPKFLLGMTATPERTDNTDIFKLFDYNVAYEIRLHQALEQELLCPFHYFAIEDLYLESERVLAKNFTKLVSDSRVDHIIEKIKFYDYSGKHRAALMFVSNVDEALELADKLNLRGIKAKALTSKDPEHTRDLAISELESNQLEIIISVDIFNEGVDIPCLNQIILLRPTQSAIIYIQQLGRGLRKHKNKKFVVVLDFIANYDNNFLIPVALSQNNSYDKDELKKFIISPNNYLAGKSTITFSNIAKELIYKNIQKTNFSQLKNIKKDYIQLKKKLGRIPYLIDFQQHNFISPETILLAKDSYYDILRAFKEDIPELSLREYNLIKFISKEFTPSKRLYEILIIEQLLQYKSINIKKLEQKIKSFLDDYDNQSFINALRHLALQIFTVNAGRKDYDPIIDITNQTVRLLAIDLINQNEFLAKQIIDLIRYNKLVYTQKYSSNKHASLTLYAKYSKKDIAHLLNQDYTNGGVNLAGYRVFDKKALLFMTFDEDKRFSSHENYFTNPQTFTYYSKAGKSLSDNIEKNLFNNVYQTYVFARVNKSASYFFLGIVSQCISAEEITLSKKVVKYIFKLQQSLPREMWQYFKVVYKSKK